MKRVLLFVLSVFILLGCLVPPMRAHAATGERKAGAVTTSSTHLNVRVAASANAAVVGKLSKGSYITLISRAGDWWQVEYGKDRYGYCHKEYITPIQGSPATVTAGALNVRTGPGTSYGRAATLYSGERVLLLTSSGDWSRVLYHGTKTGYVSSRYLSGSLTVSLSVPSFKQTDSRWANVTLGASGKTMGKIGCATTAIAMMESYRTGRTIYPDAMSRQLRYTTSGSVYWPSHYTAVTDSASYLPNIYKKLQQGSPILFGAKNTSGSQHWVVITGFTGGTMTAANFTIRDPGSGSRTNLQQFLNAYPNFYKYFYY